MKFKDGDICYTPGDTIIRLELRQRETQNIPRLVAILDVAKREIVAELKSNLRWCGIEGGEPVTQAFEGFLRYHDLVQSPTPTVAGKKKKYTVAYVRRSEL